VIGVGVGRGETREGMGRQGQGETALVMLRGGVLGRGYWVESVMGSGSRFGRIRGWQLQLMNGR
jgi:hypothetical protein